MGKVSRKCCGLNANWLMDCIVRGVRNRREYAMMGRQASDIRGRTGVGGKSSWRRDAFKSDGKEKATA